MEGAEEYVLEDKLAGAEMSQDQVNEEINVRREHVAYSNGWKDGRFGSTRLFLENANLAEWEGFQERLAYYRGHRDGRRVREVLEHRDSA